MVNPGAIATTSLVPGATIEERWQFILDGLSRFAGRELAIDEEIYASASADQLTATRRIADCSQSFGRSAGPGGGGRPLHAAVFAAT